MKEAILASIAAIILAGCGGSSSAVTEEVAVPDLDGEVAEEENDAPVAVVLAPANGNLGPNNISFAQSESGIEVFVTLDGETKSLTGLTATLEELEVVTALDSSFNLVAGTDFAALLGGLFGGGQDRPIDLALGFAAGTDAAAASVGALITFDPEGNGLEDLEFATGTAFARLTETTLPVSGTATYSGDYIGVLLPSEVTEDALNDLDVDQIAVAGNVTLDADFANATISGGVTDRDFVKLTGESEILAITEASAFSDITFASTAIDDTGAFTGVASADPSNVLGTDITTEDGVFSGLIAGETGNEAVGAVVLNHTTETGAVTEFGSFIAQ